MFCFPRESVFLLVAWLSFFTFEHICNFKLFTIYLDASGVLSASPSVDVLSLRWLVALSAWCSLVTPRPLFPSLWELPFASPLSDLLFPLCSIFIFLVYTSFLWYTVSDSIIFPKLSLGSFSKELKLFLLLSFNFLW